MIELASVTKRYGRLTAVNDLSFRVSRGEIVGLLGPNGAGKTTTLRLMTGLLRPTQGSITVAGIDVAEDPRAAREAIGYLPETSPLPRDMAVYSFLQFAGRMRRLSRSEVDGSLRSLAPACGISEVIHRPIRELSKGYRQRVGLAYALLGDPQVLILDEPTSGLDPNQILEVRALISALGREKTVILSTHHLAEVEATCQRAIILAQGRVVADAAISERQPSGMRDLERFFSEVTGRAVGGV